MTILVGICVDVWQGCVCVRWVCDRGALLWGVWEVGVWQRMCGMSKWGADTRSTFARSTPTWSTLTISTVHEINHYKINFNEIRRWPSRGSWSRESWSRVRNSSKCVMCSCLLIMHLPSESRTLNWHLETICTCWGERDLWSICWFLVAKQPLSVARENQEKVLSWQKGTRQWKRTHKTQRRLKLHQTQQASVPIDLAIHCTLYYMYIVLVLYS